MSDKTVTEALGAKARAEGRARVSPFKPGSEASRLWLYGWDYQGKVPPTPGAYGRLTEYEKAVADIAAHTVQVTIEGTGLPKPLSEHMIDVRESIAKMIYDNRSMTIEQHYGID